MDTNRFSLNLVASEVILERDSKRKIIDVKCSKVDYKFNSMFAIGLSDQKKLELKFSVFLFRIGSTSLDFCIYTYIYDYPCMYL